MARQHVTGRILAAILSVAAAIAIQDSAVAQRPPLTIEIPDPGKTGLARGRYRVEIGRADAAKKDHAPEVTLISVATPATRHRYDARITGCGNSEPGTLSWTPRVVGRPDGSLLLELTSGPAPGCRVRAAIPAAPVPGIEGTPIGTAGAPAQKTPGIEGSPFGTAGAPQTPGARGRTGSADREIEQLMVKAQQALPRVACTHASRDIEAQLAPMASSLRQVASAPSAAGAVQPLRRFDAARQALYRSLARDRDFAAAAGRCRDVEQRCAASGSVASGCGIEAAVCLARVLCAARN